MAMVKAVEPKYKKKQTAGMHSELHKGHDLW